MKKSDPIEWGKEVVTIISEAIKEIGSPQEVVQNKPSQGVKFDKGTESEYTVVFSQRGFLVDNTRFSFDEIKSAVSKEYTIVTKSGFQLNAVRMQQILKYENYYVNR